MRFFSPYFCPITGLPLRRDECRHEGPRLVSPHADAAVQLACAPLIGLGGVMAFMGSIILNREMMYICTGIGLVFFTVGMLRGYRQWRLRVRCRQKC